MPITASYSHLGSEMHSMREFSAYNTLPGDFRSKHVTSGSLPVTCGYVTSFPVT